MAYFNLESLLIDTEKFPCKQDKVDAQIALKRKREKGVPLLIDNAFQVIGNPEAYYAHRQLGDKAVYGQRITYYKENPVYPDRFSIEISSKCNFECVMCPRTVLKREESFMDEELFRKVVDDIAQHEVSMVDLYRLGEATYHPKFSEFLDYVDRLEKPFPSTLFSNGGLITPELLERIMNSSILIFALSINSLDEKTYEKITGSSDVYQHVQHLVKMAKGLKRGRTPFFGVQFIEQGLTHDQMNEFLNRYIDNVDFIESSMLEDFGSQLKQNTEYIEKHNINKDVKITRPPCQRSVWGRCRIYSNGDVVPCICDINAEFLKMGNVRDNTISEIFNSDNWKQFKQMHLDGTAADHPLCGPCKDWMIYTGMNKKNKVYL